ncbi:restriction endonuclease subunit S [Vibrio parahaemolyticus]|uniref:restriction endonuclease subunit S n=1 Tax=Vibrio parahaemolyticus TaxID=670 RepID=UPI001124A5D1|nr:restriction endonuclease subunit S [Vibrio parahaemolyticus]TOL78775.1 restriction endonuclease subunit S [Vibrio parahaemolyticus]
MSCNWPIVKLGDYCSKIGSGATPKGGNSVYLDHGEISLIRSQNIYNEGFKSDGLVYITPEAAQKLKNVIIEPNDVLINITGDSVARVCLAPNEFLPARVNQHVAILRVDPEEFDHRYLRYFLTSTKMQNYLLTIASTGGTRNALTKSMLESLEVSKPLLDVQKRIGDVLESFESKIELNSRTNQTLEEMAQAIFKSWFVDFDPVKAKMNGEQPEGMDAATASLFPEKLVESELGLIPEGWEVGELSDLMDFNPKRTLKKGTVAPYLDMKNMPTAGHLALDIYDREMGSGTKFVNGDALLARITPCLENGKTAFVDFLEDEQVGWGSTEYIVMRSKSDSYKYFSYFMARFEPFRKFAIQSMTGTSGRQRAQAKTVQTMPFVIPPLSILEKFDELIAANMQLIKRHGDENKTLAELRDTLLPKLLSGEIELGQAQELAEVE